MLIIAIDLHFLLALGSIAFGIKLRKMMLFLFFFFFFFFFLTILFIIAIGLFDVIALRFFTFAHWFFRFPFAPPICIFFILLVFLLFSASLLFALFFLFSLFFLFLLFSIFVFRAMTT